MWVSKMRKDDILKTKSNFTLLLYIPFLGIGEGIFNVFNSY